MKKTITYNEVKKTCLDVINGGGGGTGVKTFTYPANTDGSRHDFELPEDCHYILRATASIDTDVNTLSWCFGFPAVNGCYGLIGVINYANEDRSELWYCRARIHDDNKLIFEASSNDWHLPYEQGKALTIYYI